MFCSVIRRRTHPDRFRSTLKDMRDVSHLIWLKNSHQTLLGKTIFPKITTFKTFYIDIGIQLNNLKPNNTHVTLEHGRNFCWHYAIGLINWLLSYLQQLQLKPFHCRQRQPYWYYNPIFTFVVFEPCIEANKWYGPARTPINRLPPPEIDP